MVFEQTTKSIFLDVKKNDFQSKIELCIHKLMLLVL